MVDLDDALERIARLESAAAEVGELPWADLPVSTVCDLLARLERVSAALPGLRRDRTTGAGQGSRRRRPAP